MELLSSSLFLIIIHILVMVSAVSCVSDSVTAPARCHEDEFFALLHFKNNFVVMKKTKYGDSVNPMLESWKAKDRSSSDCCSWDGVVCDEETGHVIGLGLKNAGLYGSFINSSSLFKLVHLQRLDLSGNDFNGSQIPYGFGLLSRLTHLDLLGSGFSGEVPSDIFTITRLASLRLGNYLLQLKSPGLVQNLTRLQELHLESMHIPSPFPDAIANMSSLTSLTMAGISGLYGLIPARLFLLQNFKRLRIVGNDVNNPVISIHFPPEFNTSSPLQVLHLIGINFATESSIPSSLGNLTELTDLYLSRVPCDAQELSSLSWLWKLTKLKALVLEEMKLQGQIPSSIGKLSGDLNLLALNGNQLSGSIPTQFMNLTRLHEVYLYRNQLSGPIPSWISNMTQLSTINFSFNRFRGSIPSSSFSQLQNLRALYLYRARLSGTVELDMFLNLKKLHSLLLSSNKLTCQYSGNNTSTSTTFISIGLSSCNLSEFPSFLRNQQKLEWLDLSENNIRGQVPEWMGHVGINSLLCLNLSNNFLTGFDPPRNNNILPWKSLCALDLTSNSFQGPLPIPPASVIESYLLSNNNLTGVLPSWVCGLRTLKFLDLSSNDLSGKLPPCMGYSSSTSLSVLNLQQNRFDGSIPEFCARGTQLIKMISLRDNHLHGRLPRSLANCLMLEFIDFGYNQITDTFPSWFGNLTQLEVLILNNNKFHGFIMNRVHLSFKKLRIIDLSHNALTGPLPDANIRSWNSMRVAADQNGVTYMQIGLKARCEINYYTLDRSYDFDMTLTDKGIQLFYSKVPKIFKIVDLSSNMFEGEIPDVIGGLQGIHSLNLSNNLLTGGIPSSIGNLTALESLDLSHNELKGEIPEELAKLNFLSKFDVSYNDLMGPIPKGQQFNTFPETSFEGNLGLCGDIIHKKCGGSDNAEPSSFEHEEEDSDNWWTKIEYMIIAMGYGCGLVVGVVLGNEFAWRRHGRFAAFMERRITQRRGGKQRRRHGTRNRI